MKTIIGVRFRQAGKIYYFDPMSAEVQRGDYVIVETARGVEYGEVMVPPREVEDERIVAPLKSVIRVATKDDMRTIERNAVKEKEAHVCCQEKIASHGLAMKLVDVECAFNGGKIIFYFTAEERIDFRELVKDLAAVFKTRIELRQIGVRDEAKMLGGLGSCGLPVCCKQFLGEFQPVSIKMAKEQNLSLSPTKISGFCGRLMCCLKYEQENYENMRKQMPRINKDVISPDGQGVVVDNNMITARTKVRVTLPDGTFTIKEYPFEILKRVNADQSVEETQKQDEKDSQIKE